MNVERFEVSRQGDDRSAWRTLVGPQRPTDAAPEAALRAWLVAREAPEQFALDVLRDAQALLVETYDPDGTPEAYVSDLMRHMPGDLVTAALRREPHPGWHREFLLLMIQRLAPDAALRLVEVAMAAVAQPLAPPMIAVLRGLLGQAVAGPSSIGELRAALAGYVRAASEEDVHAVTTGFESLYDRRNDARVESRATPEAERILQLSIETGVAGRVTWMALSELVDDGRGGEALGMLAEAPAQNAATHAIASRFATARELAALLREEPVDFAKVDLVVSVMGSNAAPSLLEALAESKSRATRRGVLDRLTQMGPGIVPFIESRLRDSRWFVVRNMLGLLRAVDHRAAAAELERFIAHTDPRVRREAILLLIADPIARDRAVGVALKDQDAQVLRAVLGEMGKSLPDAGVPVLSKRLRDGDFPAELRARALQLLGTKASTLALDALLHYAHAGRTLFGKPKLAPPSAEMVAAVAGLARSWRHDARARVILEVAARSSDAEVVKATRAHEES